RCGALLSNTLPARGLFHDHPFGLGTTGSYFTSLGRETYESADVVLAVGTSLSYYVGGGHYFAKACKIQLDDAPRGLSHGQKAARARSCCSKETAGSCTISRSSRRSSVKDFAS